MQLGKEEQLEKLRHWESANRKLKDELEDASHQLTVNSSDLANSKIELQRHRTEIDVSLSNRIKCIPTSLIFFDRIATQR